MAQILRDPTALRQLADDEVRAEIYEEQIAKTMTVDSLWAVGTVKSYPRQTYPRQP